MKGTPTYARRAQKSAVSGSREQYMKVKAIFQTAAARVTEKSVSETEETRRARTLAPKPNISRAVKAVGTAYAEKPYPAASVMDMWLSLSLGLPAIVRDADHDCPCTTCFSTESTRDICARRGTAPPCAARCAA